VMAGRDIGTVVLPQARHKFFLTASLDERVKRRRAELQAAGVHVDEASLRAQIEERDRLDASRAIAPLRPASDAVTIDSTSLSIDDVVAAMLDRIGQGARS
jgi:cytidylate kinase